MHIGGGMLKNRNSFDSIRLIGSLIVLIGHSFIITGGSAPKIGSIALHSFGVCIFFVISGFLITQSWMSDRNVTRFLQRRALRIFPALVVVVVVTALIIGPIATSETLHMYFRHGWTYRYVFSNSLLITVWGLPGVFTELPVVGQANGSLWTLPIEFGLYLIVPAIVFLNRAFSSLSVVVFIIALSVFTVLAGQHFTGFFTFNFHGIDFGKGLALAPYFWIGSALRLLDFGGLSDKVKNGAFYGSLIVVTIWALLAIQSPWIIAIAIIPIAILVIFVGLSDWLHSPMIIRIGDISYGLYLWAFPVQQLIMLKLGGSWLFNLATSLPVTAIFAYASWHLIERTALRYKPKRLLATVMSREPSGCPDC